MPRKLLIAVVSLLAVLSGCTTMKVLPKDQNDVALQRVNLPSITPTQPKLLRSPAPDITTTPTTTQTITLTPPQDTSAPIPTATPDKIDVGPDQYPSGVNPLTGLPVKNPENLLIPPALVSITNFPTTARPQAGLSFSPIVYEIYIGEGATRFLAIFYGDYPELPADQSTSNAKNAAVGPIRSGRLPYELLRKLYNGFLVMASAWEKVAVKLNYTTDVYGTDPKDINSAMIDVTRMEKIAHQNQERLGTAALSGQRFSSTIPDGGLNANKAWIHWSFLNQTYWQYNPTTQTYNRYQDEADGKTYTQMTDRLNGNPLSYDNVVILFADHTAHYETVIDINFMYITKMPALLLRDGKMYEIYWTTRNDVYEKATGKVRPIRFVDAQGSPFPLKPGQTWVEVIPSGTPYQEIPDSSLYYDQMHKTQPGSGVWMVYFKAPPVIGK